MRPLVLAGMCAVQMVVFPDYDASVVYYLTELRQDANSPRRSHAQLPGASVMCERSFMTFDATPVVTATMIRLPGCALRDGATPA